MKLPRLAFRRLQSRLVAVFLSLILAIQLASYAAINTAIDDAARRHARSELATGERVVQRLIAQRGQRLAQAASVLAGDFGFREAIATRDAGTIASVLENHGERIRADVVMLADVEGRPTAATGSAGTRAPDAVTRLVQRAARGGDDTGIALVDGRPCQIVVAPVRAPLVIGWVAMGFLLDDALAGDLGGLTGLAVSIASEGGNGFWTLRASTLGAADRLALGARLPAIFAASDGVPFVAGDGEAFETRAAPLVTLDGQSTAIVLQRSLDRSTASFRRLQNSLLALTLLAMPLALGGSAFLARRVSRPVQALAGAARRIEQGDYTQPIAIDSVDELGELASAFRHMREGIEARERRIVELAYSDPLTGLPNRALFNDRSAQAVTAARRAGGELSVLQLDLDRFKYVNDTLGHLIGDRVLREVAVRLRRAVQREGDTVARLGGDEFGVLLPTDAAEGAVIVARRILDTLSEPITVDGQLVDVGASIGIAQYPAHGTDADALLRHADVAMYAAKRAGSGCVVYDPRYDENTPERLSLLAELRRAVELDELMLLYQPKLDLAQRGVHWVEALLRWEHPARGHVVPERFIPFAEQTGYIKQITRWVVEKAVAQCAAWRARGVHVGVCVNVSARDLHNPDFPGYLAGVLARHGLPARLLALELTESAVMEDATHALEILQRLHASGIRLSIDDFGTGYSSLAYLKRLPVDELKIDKSFIFGLTRDAGDATIVRSTIDLAHNMGLEVTAEGVEDGEVLGALERLGCDVAQGYHISRPLRPEDLERWLRERASRSAASTALVD